MPYEPDKDPNYLEWKDAREVTGKFDSMLLDLRKYGFTFITGLTTASSFLGFATPNFLLLLNVITITMALIVILYWLDVYYQNLLYGAVTRTMFLELFKLQQSGRRGLAAFIGSLHSFARIRYFLHGIYYGFLFILFVLGLFVSFMPANQGADNSTIELKMPKSTSLTLDKADLKTTENIPEKSSSFDYKPILIGAFIVCLGGMITISVTSDRKREQRWNCICKYMSKKQLVQNLTAQDVELIEDVIYYIFSGGKYFRDNNHRNQIKGELVNMRDCTWLPP